MQMHVFNIYSLTHSLILIFTLLLTLCHSQSLFLFSHSFLPHHCLTLFHILARSWASSPLFSSLFFLSLSRSQWESWVNEEQLFRTMRSRYSLNAFSYEFFDDFEHRPFSAEAVTSFIWTFFFFRSPSRRLVNNLLRRGHQDFYLSWG